MSDPRFFAILLAVFAVAIVALLCGLDYFQPGPVNSELIKQILYLVSPIFSALIVLMNSNANRQQLRSGQEEVKSEVKHQGVAMANKAADIAYTASEMARQKGKYA